MLKPRARYFVIGSFLIASAFFLILTLGQLTSPHIHLTKALAQFGKRSFVGSLFDLIAFYNLALLSIYFFPNRMIAGKGIASSESRKADIIYEAISLLFMVLYSYVVIARIMGDGMNIQEGYVIYYLIRENTFALLCYFIAHIFKRH